MTSASQLAVDVARARLKEENQKDPEAGPAATKAISQMYESILGKEGEYFPNRNNKSITLLTPKLEYDQKEVEDAIIQLEMVLKRTSGISHDMLTPITSMNLASQLLLNRYLNKELSAEDEAAIEKKYELLTRSLNKMKDLLVESDNLIEGRFVKEQLQTADLASLIATVAEDLQKQDQERGQKTVNWQVDDPTQLHLPDGSFVWGSPDIHRFIHNLHSNAVKAGANNVQVHFMVQQDPQTGEHSLYAVVEDDGPGLPPVIASNHEYPPGFTEWQDGQNGNGIGMRETLERQNDFFGIKITPMNIVDQPFTPAKGARHIVKIPFNYKESKKEGEN